MKTVEKMEAPAPGTSMLSLRRPKGLRRSIQNLSEQPQLFHAWRAD